MATSPLRNTIDRLRLCQTARAAGCPISYTTDPTWLVHMAINRRAGWPDDPSLTRGSATPVNGQYPKRASGDDYWDLKRISLRVNTPRLIVRENELGQWKRLIMARIPNRITSREDF